ncbi:MAG: tetratricopeptide repeat protein [Rhodoferax sp.]|nr:tetratricopeptide repeat protein [Rhodoferax sp.]
MVSWPARYSSGFGPEWLLRYAQRDAPGEVITFYSYKGGTGRTMALANCAGLMAERWPATAKPMLLIDFDLEAPGLHHYLRDFLPMPAELDDQPGTLELFEALKQQVSAAVAAKKTANLPGAGLNDEECHHLVAAFDFTPYLIATTQSPIHLIKAGRFDHSYAKRLSRMNWQRLFTGAPGIFRALAARWAQDYACTMIDARTGLSDTSGICTMLLPDVLTVVFTPNRQSLTGVSHIVRQAQTYRDTSADLRPLRVYPLPSRVEQTSEDARETWRRGVAQHPTFGPVDGYQPMFEQLFDHPTDDCEQPVDVAKGLGDYFDAVQVPHSPDYAFGERLCFGPAAAKDRLSLRSAFEAFLPWLSSGAQPWMPPRARLNELALEQWLATLTPPASDEPQVFKAWLDQIQAATTGAETLGYVVLREALLAMGQHQQLAASSALNTLLPQGILLKALALMHGGDWIEARQLFMLAHNKPEGHGLPSDWETVPRRWLAYLQANPTHVLSWLHEKCDDAMLKWVDAVSLSRHERWQWMADLVAVYQQYRTNDDRCKELATQLLAQQQKVLGSEHPATLTSMNNLASTLQAMGELPAARTMQEQELAVCQRVLGVEHPDTLNSMNNLASTLQAMGELPAARTMQEQVLAVRQRVLGSEHPATLTSMNNLASTLKDMGELPAARTMEEQVLAVRQRVLGVEHPDTLTSMSNLASTLWNMGELSAARTMQEQVLAARQRVLGSEHPATLNSMNNLASTLWNMGELPAARAMEEQVLAARQRVLGVEHPDTLTSMNNLAGTLKDMGELPAARAMQEQVLAARQRVLGSEHPATLTSMGNLASTLRAMGELPAARAMQEQVLAVHQRVQSSEHPHTLTSMNNLAITLQAMGELPAARAMQEQVLAARQRVLGVEHPDTLTSMNNLASTLWNMGELPAARAMQEQVLAVRQRVLGVKHPDTLTSMNNLAITLQAMGELPAARAMQEQVLAVRQRVLGSEHPDTLKIFAALLRACQEASDQAAVSELLSRYPDLADAMFRKISAPETTQSSLQPQDWSASETMIGLNSG